MFLAQSCALSLRSYGRDNHLHSHDYSQLVLPLSGKLGIDIDGREAELDRGAAAYIDKGLRHTQEGRETNQFLIVDFDPSKLAPHIAERLSSHPILPLTPQANHLIDYMGAALSNAATSNNVTPTFQVRLWAPLLFDALADQAPKPRSRLTALLADVEGNPFLAWTSATMARRAGLSVSRLHALFRKELNTTPHTWLAHARLERVQHWLATTHLPIAELAYRGGYADQSALTRALRKATGLTPAAFRRRYQEEFRPK